MIAPFTHYSSPLRAALFCTVGFLIGFQPIARGQEAGAEQPAEAADVAPTSLPETSESAEEAATSDDSAEATDSALPTNGERRPTSNVTINLIQLMVKRGLITQEEADDMIRQARTEAEIARAQSQSEMFAIAQAAAVQAAAEQIALVEFEAAPPEDGDITVGYIPAPVRDRIKEEIKAELLLDDATDPFGVSGLIPEWIRAVRFTADVRVRYDGTMFPDGNDATGSFPNFNAINTGLPFDVTGFQFAPQYNVDQDRNRFRLRARFGAEFDLENNFSIGLRLATGDNSSPVSTNQTFGRGGGNFSKYDLWLDRAYIRSELWSPRTRGVRLSFGRFDNPFFSTPLIWDDDLGWDGGAIQVNYLIRDEGLFPNVGVFVNAGAFPVFNTDFDFATNQPAKFESYDKYLGAVQAGLDFKITKDWNFKAAAAYYFFENIEGELSSPFTPLVITDQGDTDISRPSFAQKGNTYFPIRNITPDVSNDFGAINQWQYYGLATKYELFALTGRLDYNGFDPVQVSLIGEWVRNIRFNKDEIDQIAVNNRGPDNDELDDAFFGVFDGDDVGWLAEIKVGTPQFTKLWDWSLSFGYRYIGSDAVVDAFNDSDFGLGGTNVKGYTAAGSLALARDVALTLRWMASENLAGPPLKADIIQVDLNAKF